MLGFLVSPCPHVLLGEEQLWQSTVEALECRATWRPPSAGAGAAGAAGFGVRQGYLALYGISSELFQAWAWMIWMFWMMFFAEALFNSFYLIWRGLDPPPKSACTQILSNNK
jgi:hypothetical protein